MTDRTEIERLLAEWHEHGDPARADAFLAAHPEHADDLRKHLGLLGLVEHAFQPRPALPESVGPFRIERELGSGGMGTVYRAVVSEPVRGIATGRTVALKVVHPHLFRTQGFFKRFLREAELGQRIEHPNVVRTLDADAVEIDDRPQHYLVMEYVEGQTLRDLMDEVDRVPEELARHVGCEVAKALSAIHAAGAVHRDLKPENVLITPDHQVKVMDLGVARLADEAVRLSQTGAFVGSLHYAAPEQLGGGADIDARADLHGLGLLLYEIATGTNPYADEDARVVMRRILSEAPRKAGELNPQLSPFFEELLVQLLSKDPAERFESAQLVLSVLESAEGSDWWRARARDLRVGSGRPLRRIRVPRETAVYGREAELARLRTIFDAVRAGDGRALLVEGEAGIGKTRLVDEFVARLQQDGEDVNFLFASYPPGGAATASGAFSAAYREHLGTDDLEDSLRELLPQTPVLVPAFAALLRGDVAPRSAQPLTKDSLQTCFVHVTRNLAAARLTVVLIDDLHFAPEEGRALFSSLALAVPGHRILLIGTMRPGVPEEWTASLTRLEHTELLTVPRLGPKDLVQLLGDTFKSERLAEELSGKIAVKSDGNPFFAFEIVRGLREGQFIRQRDDGSWETTRLIEDIEVPSSVLDLVNARVAELDEDERSLLDVASCSGYEFDPALVAEAAGIPRVPALRRLAQIEKKHRLVRSVGRRMAFDHHQVQEALYGALPELLREEYHRALAEVLETSIAASGVAPEELDGDTCVSLCEHFFGGAADRRALRYLSAAQVHLETSHLNARSVDLATRALATPGLLEGEARASLLRKLCRGNGPLDRLQRLGDRAEIARELEQLSRRLDDEGGELAALLALGSSQLELHDLEVAEQTLVRAASLAREAHDSSAVILALKVLGDVYRRASRFRDAQAVLEEASELRTTLASQRSDVPDPRPNLGAVLAELGQLEEAEKCFEGYLDAVRAADDTDEEAAAVGMLGSIWWSQERHAEARAAVEHSLERARVTGNRRTELRTVSNLAGIVAEMGDLERALALNEQQEQLARESASQFDLVLALANRGSILLRLGRTQEARGLLGSVLTTTREGKFRWLECHVLTTLSHLADDAGDLDTAIGLAERALGMRRELEHGLELAGSLVHLGCLLHRAGRLDRAKPVLEEALGVAKEQGLTRTIALASGVLAVLPGGSIEKARQAATACDDPQTLKQVYFLLWEASGEMRDLQRARHLLEDEMLRLAPEEREAHVGASLVDRQILDAWRAHGDSTPSSESATGAG